MEESVTFGKRRNMKSDEPSTTPETPNQHPILEPYLVSKTSFTPDCIESLQSENISTPDYTSLDDGKLHGSSSLSFASERSLKHRSEFQKRPPLDTQHAVRKTNFLAKKLAKSSSGVSSPSKFNDSNQQGLSSVEQQVILGYNNPDTMWKVSKSPSSYYSLQPVSFHNKGDQVITLSECTTMEKKLEYLNDVIAKMEKRTRELKAVAMKQQVIIDTLKKKLGKN